MREFRKKIQTDFHLGVQRMEVRPHGLTAGSAIGEGFGAAKRGGGVAAWAAGDAL